MRVDPTKQAAFGQTGKMPRDAALAPAELDSGSHALVVLAPTATPIPSANYRRAAFLAHLIAVKEQLPQTRERRRAEPAEAIAAYLAGEALVP
jgi:hypothetical protein